jgi:hypothetical protein
MDRLKPWATAPFEQLIQAERYLEKEDGYSRRMAFISYDNAIELAIPAHRAGSPWRPCFLG